MAGVARLAELITADFYGRRLDFSARNPGNNDWRSLPEIEVTDRMPPTDAAVATDGLRNEKASGRTVRLFLTFVAAVDKMRDATQLWRAAGSLFRSNPEVFNPAKVCSMPPESLGKLLRDSGVTKYHKPQVLAWRRIAVSLASGKGPVCRVVDSGDGDAEELLRDVRSRDSRGPRYPELRGDKIRLMWVRMMAEPGKAEIRRLETVPVAVDVQVRRVTENLGVTNTYGPELNNRIKKQIQQAWSDGVAAAKDWRSGTDRRNVLRARSGALVLRQARVQPLRDGEATGALRSGVRRLSVSASSTIGLRSGQPFRPPCGVRC